MSGGRVGWWGLDHLQWIHSRHSCSLLCLPNCLLSSLTINISPQPSLAVAAAMSAAALSPWGTIPKAALGRRGSI